MRKKHADDKVPDPAYLDGKFAPFRNHFDGQFFNIEEGANLNDPVDPATLGDIWDHFIFHEHYVYHSARPRSNHSTIEFRAACQQPITDYMVR